ETELLRVAAAVESRSTHPLARAIVRAAGERGLEISKPDSTRATAGLGIEAQWQGKRVRIGGPAFFARDGDSEARLSPGSFLSLDFKIEFDCGAISRQSFSIGVVNGSFAKELARARTFGFLHEVEALWAAGFAKGGSLENAVVVSGDKVLNEGGLRYDDEFVRHKILDAVGDLYLAGAPIIGKFEGVYSGHATNNALLRTLFADPEAWKYDVFQGQEALTAIDGGIFPELADTA
ncbi:MAG: UDP-3-O-acyl-N-acetylglucosamine deacetylase, partial [Proteobacteria bacterium]|nr:UDP-3-O-acyl-N-acetylglucosamine deacetylase [Pseudomonadota bacterium]